MKKIILAGLGIVFLFGFYFILHVCWIEPSWFEVIKTDILLPPDKIFNEPVRILHLSDFHDGDAVSYSMIEKAVDIGIKEKPDLILLTGDFLTWKIADPEKYAKVLEKLSAAAPAFACLGNHDGGSWAAKSKGYKDTSLIEKLLRDCRIKLLINQSANIEINGNKLKIVGLGDLWAETMNPQEILSERNIKNKTPILLLAHNPDSKNYLIDYEWDIMFSGHTHGGQLVLPLTGIRPFAPVRDLDFVEGLHEWENRYIYITKGVGNLHGKRFNCRPEISIITVSAYDIKSKTNLPIK